MLRLRSTKCDQYAAFWNKTAPLWDKMTQCLRAHSVRTLTVGESEQSVPKAYLEEKNRRYLYDLTDDRRPSALVQQIMMNDVKYYLSDAMMVEMIEKAKLLSGPDASAAEVLQLTRCMIEYESDVKSNVDYMVSGLAERAVFEFTKKIISEKIYVDLRKTIDRLKHLNDDGIIPTKLIKSKKKAEVTSFVFEMINNNNDYGRFDNLVDDDPRYVAQISETAEDRMKKFLFENLQQTKMSATRFPMDQRDKLFEHVNDVVRLFLEQAHQKTAQFMSTSNLDEYEERINSVLPTSGPTRDPVTLYLVYRICRKLSKLLFGMFATEERVTHNYKATLDAYVLLVANRTNRVNYHRKFYKLGDDVTVNDFLKLYEETLSSIRYKYSMV